MAITQGLLRNDFSYRAPYGSNRRSPSYTNPQRGAAKAPAPAATGALESRSVVRGPGIANDEMDESDDAEMITQTQTPLTANARGPRYTEGSMMDLFTGQRTGTKNANYNADQPITDTNTPYLATKGFWGGLDRVLGNKSNELNEAAQQQQGAKWDAANKLKSSQDREDTVTKNANTFITGRDTAKVTADKDTASSLAGVNKDAATALAGSNATRDNAQAGYAREAATAANTRSVAAANTQDDFNKAAALLIANAKTQEQKDMAASRIAELGAKNGFDVAAATEAFTRAEKLQKNALSNDVKETSNGTFIKNGQVYVADPTDELNYIPVNFEKTRGSGGSGGNTGPGRATKNGQGGEAKTAAQPPASQASDAASVTRSSEPAYLSSDNSPSQNQSLGLNYFGLGTQIPRGLSIQDTQARSSGVNPNAQSSESLGRERASRRTSEQLGLDYSEANPNTQSPENLNFRNQLRQSQEPLEDSLRFPEGFDFNSPEVQESVPPPSVPPPYVPEFLRNMKKDDSRGYKLEQDNNPKRSKPRFYTPR